MAEPSHPGLRGLLTRDGPRQVTISGPPSCGRTTALEDLARAAKGWTVLQATGLAADCGHPLVTVQRLCAGWAAGAADLRAARGLGPLASLVPELGDAQPVDRARLQGELGLWVRRLAADAPVLVIVDDLHLADADSFDLLDAVRRSDGAACWAFGWCRADAIVPGATPPEAGAVIALDAALGAVSPRRLAERLQLLEPDLQALLCCLAAAGLPVLPEELAEASGRALERLDRALDLLVLRGWVRVVPDGAALQLVVPSGSWREALLERIGPMQRRRLGQAWAQALAARTAEARAPHLHLAGTSADAAAWEDLRAGAAAALQAGRPADAVRWLRTATDLAERSGTPRAGLLEELGIALQSAGDLAAAAACWEEALDCAPGAAQHARLRRLLALHSWDHGRAGVALEHLRRGRQALGDGPPGPTRSHSSGPSWSSWTGASAPPSSTMSLGRSGRSRVATRRRPRSGPRC